LLENFWSAQRFQIIRHGADHGDAQSIGVEDQIGLGREELSVDAGHVGGNDWVCGGLDKLAGLHPAVIEIVIAERAGVETKQVGDFEDRKAVKDGGDGSALRQVAGIEEDAILAVGAFAPDHRGEIGEAAVMVFKRHQARVEVVGVQYGQRPDFRRQWSACQQRERQKAPGPALHIAHCSVR
jgi:hypothetical protein